MACSDSPQEYSFHFLCLFVSPSLSPTHHPQVSNPTSSLSDSFPKLYPHSSNFSAISYVSVSIPASTQVLPCSLGGSILVKSFYSSSALQLRRFSSPSVWAAVKREPRRPRSIPSLPALMVCTVLGARSWIPHLSTSSTKCCTCLNLQCLMPRKPKILWKVIQKWSLTRFYSMPAISCTVCAVQTFQGIQIPNLCWTSEKPDFSVFSLMDFHWNSKR